MTNKRPIANIIVSSDHGTLIVNRHDYATVANGSYGVGFQILNNSSFDQDEIKFVIELLKLRRHFFGNGVIAIDCGANIGAHTVEWGKLMHDWGYVYSFEAQEKIFYMLAGNIAINNCFNVRATWAAVSNEFGSFNVPAPNYLTPSSFGSLEILPSPNNEFIGQHISYEPVNGIKTPLTTLDSLNLTRLDLIKIDVEGMEIQVLEGAMRTIKSCLPIIIAEKIKTNESMLTSILNDLGYKLFPLGLNCLAVHESDPTINNVNAA